MTALQPGATFASRFEIDRQAGSGGMGAVYRAYDKESRTWVALKLLHGSQDAAQESSRFTQEAQLLAELRHPNIVSYVAHGRAEEQHYLAMEWLEGEDLATRLQKGPLSLPECEILLTRIADGLAVAHAHDIIHRDLKPHNLFLAAGQIEQVKILDFGIARRILPQHGLTRTGSVIGTPGYMAPEQARGVRELSPAADIFALGCVLYECLTGNAPFSGDHFAAVLVRILFEEPPPLAERRLGIPPALSALVQKMLAKDVAQRLPDALALRHALSEMLLTTKPPPLSTLETAAPQILHFSGEDQRLFSVVVAQPHPVADPSSATLRGSDTDEQERRRALLSVLGTFGVRVEFLINGALVVTVDAAGSLTDQAVHAGRAAILIKERWPEAAVAVATGRGMVKGQKPVGEVVSRALTLLTHPEGFIGSDHQAGVWVDTLSAQLMERRFRLSSENGTTQLLGEDESADSSRLLLGKPTPCCGRELELGTIDIQLQNCIDESEARAILITAPPGSGKSRLRHEFLRRIGPSGPARRELMTLVAQGEMMSASVPYAMLAQGLRRLCGLSGGEPLAEQRARLASRLSRHLAAPDHARVLGFLGELAGLPLTAELPPLLMAARQDPKILHEQIRRAFVDWLRAECDVAPVLLVLDDLHWGDTLTVLLMDSALRQLKNLPFCLLAFGRPEVHTLFPRLWHEHGLQELALKGLNKRACERLIQHVLGKDVPAPVVARIIDQAAGNALYLEELIRATAEGKGDSFSETVLAMLQARISRLAFTARRVLNGASIFGQTFWQGGVARLLGCSPFAPELEQALLELIDAEIIRSHDDSQIADEKEFGFRHALMRDAAYGLLTEIDRIVGHCVAAQYLTHRPDSGSHWLAALATLDALPDSNENRRRRVEITLNLMNVSRSTDTPEQNLKLLQWAAESAQKISPEHRTPEQQRQHALLHYWLGYTYYLSNQTAQAMMHFQHVLAQPIDDEQLMALPRGAIGRVKIFLGRMNEALPLLECAARASVGRRTLLVESMLAEVFYGIALTEMGRCDEGLAAGQRSTARAEELKIPILIPPTRGPLATLLVLRGEYQAAMDHLEEGLRLARESGARVYLYLLYYTAAWAQAKLGQHAEAQLSMQECLKIRDALGQKVIAPDWVAMVQAELALARGDFAEAAQRAEEAVAIAQTQNGLFSGGLARRIWAQALLSQGGAAADIRAHLAVSTQQLQDGGCALELVRTDVLYGSLAAYQGEAERAHTYFAAASAKLREFGLPQEADKVESMRAILRHGRVPLPT